MIPRCWWIPPRLGPVAGQDGGEDCAKQLSLSSFLMLVYFLPATFPGDSCGPTESAGQNLILDGDAWI